MVEVTSVQPRDLASPSSITPECDSWISKAVRNMRTQEQQLCQQITQLLYSHRPPRWGSSPHESRQELSPFTTLFVQSQGELRSLEFCSPAMLIVLEGKASLKIEEKAISLESGDLFFFPPHLNLDITHHSASNDRYEALIFEFPTTVLERFRRAYPEQVHSQTPEARQKQFTEIELEASHFLHLSESVMHVIRSLLQPRLSSIPQLQEQFHEHQLMELLLLLLQSNVRSLILQAIYPDFATQIRSLIRSNLSSDWSLERLAQAMDISTSTLKRRLRSAHVGYRQLLDEERMSRAKDLLQQSNHNIAHIALACGYKSQSRFAARFRKYYGLSPSQIRTQKSQT